MKVDILAIGVHPDDIELSCSGYLLKEIAAGRTVALLDLTHGELGTRGNAALRKKRLCWLPANWAPCPDHF